MTTTTGILSLAEISDQLDRLAAHAAAGQAETGMKLSALRRALDETTQLAREAAEAVECSARLPLAESFPDGTPRPEHPTPRQVLFLIGLALPPRLVEAKAAPVLCGQLGKVTERPCRNRVARGYDRCGKHLEGDERTAYDAARADERARWRAEVEAEEAMRDAGVGPSWA